MNRFEYELADHPRIAGVAWSDTDLGLQLAGDMRLHISIVQSGGVSCTMSEVPHAKHNPDLDPTIELQFGERPPFVWEREALVSTLRGRRLLQLAENPPFLFLYAEHLSSPGAPYTVMYLLKFSTLQVVGADRSLLYWAETD